MRGSAVGDETVEIEIEVEVCDDDGLELDSCQTVVQFLTRFSSSCLRIGGP